MRKELEAMLDLYENFPQEGQEHWKARSLSSVRFESDDEREEFMAGLRERDKQPSAPVAPPAAGSVESTTKQPVFQIGERVKCNLMGLREGGVQFSTNCESVYATIEKQVSANPPIYRVMLHFSFRGIKELDVPADRIRPF